MEMYNPPHPGKLIAEFMGERTVTDVAKHLGVTRAALSRVLNGRAAVSAEMALRLEQAFGLDADVWLRLQANFDLTRVRQLEIDVKRFRRAS